MNDSKDKPDYISKIYYLLRREVDPNYYNLNFLFSALGAVFVFGVFFTNPDEPEGGNYTMYLFGMIVLYILVVFNSIKLVEPIEQFIKIPLTRYIILTFVSGVFAYSTVQVSIELNSLFEVSGSNFKTALFFGSFIYFIVHVIAILNYYIWLAFGIFVINYLYDSYLPNKRDLNEGHHLSDFTNPDLTYPEKDNVFKGLFKKHNWKLKSDLHLGRVLVTGVFLLGIAHLGNVALKKESLSYKLYILATNYDFDTRNSCKNINDDYSVAYVGANMDKVIINKNIGKYDVKINEIEGFLRDQKYISFNRDLAEVHENFVYDKCMF